MLGSCTPSLKFGMRVQLRLEPILVPSCCCSHFYTSSVFSQRSANFQDNLRKSSKLSTNNSANHLNRRTLHTSLTNLKEYKKSRLEVFKSKWVSAEDLNKRPSDLEIAKKGLPENQPTLLQRIERDRRHMFHQMDPKHGYWTKYVNFVFKLDSDSPGQHFICADIYNFSSVRYFPLSMIVGFYQAENS